MSEQETFDLQMDATRAHGSSLQRLVRSPWNVLNLYAGIGGNRKLWDATVTAVERQENIAAAYKSQYPDDAVIIGDAHEYLAANFQRFDFIWSSPPCQSHSRMIRSGNNRTPRYPDMSLYEEIIFLQTHCKGRWVVENVVPYYKPLIAPTAQIGRHLFWSNFMFSVRDIPSPENFITLSTVEGARKLKEWLGLNYEGNIYYADNHCPAQVLRNCVHPIIGAQILEAARTPNI